MIDPRTDRPHVPGYGIPVGRKGLLDYRHVIDTFGGARNIWVCTVRPEGRPHAMPVWGVWVGDKLYFGGGPDTRKARNLDHNPNVVVHTESGDEVAIVEGTVEKITDPERLRVIDDAYEAKYEMRHGPPVWAVTPVVAFGWTEFPKTMTRWTFNEPP